MSVIGQIDTGVTTIYQKDTCFQMIDRFSTFMTIPARGIAFIKGKLLSWALNMNHGFAIMLNA